MDLERIAMTQFLKAQFENMTKEQLIANLTTTAIENAELEAENEALTEEVQRRSDGWDPDKIFHDLGDNTNFLKWGTNGKTFVEYIQHLEKENEKLKNDRKICLQKFVGDTQVFIDLLEKYNLTEEKDLLASLKSRFVCDYCANGGCGIRPDGVECKDCYQTMKDSDEI